MFLPYQDPAVAGPTSGMAVAALPARLDEAGRLSCRFTPRQAAGGYLVRRVVVQGPAGSVAVVYVGEPDELTRADATRNGSADTADYAQPLYVPPATDLWVVWSDAAGNTMPGPAYARIETEDVT